MVPYATRLQCRVILSEKPNDGTVAITYEDIDDSIFFDVEDLLPTLPNTVSYHVLQSTNLCSVMLPHFKLYPSPMTIIDHKE